ncbi:MAG: hypothetical protein EBU77_08285 [Betaproteobacteria bacterium]|nr:hypothetical protein [Betaproteobacteria bacterium]
MSDQQPHYLGLLPDHGRFPYSAITQRETYRWPNGSGLAVYLALNIEHFAFGQGMGAAIGPLSPQPDVLNYSWREYGNRVGAWRCLDLFRQLDMPFAALINTALYDHCPELVQACVTQGAELVGHGHSNAERQGGWQEDDERQMLQMCADLMQRHSGCRPTGWLSPWISESLLTPDLLAETGYTYTLNWCHDDQPIRMSTRNQQGLWSVPYPQELNDIPMIVARQMDGKVTPPPITARRSSLSPSSRSLSACWARSMQRLSHVNPSRSMMPWLHPATDRMSPTAPTVPEEPYATSQALRGQRLKASSSMALAAISARSKALSSSCPWRKYFMLQATLPTR